MGISARQIEVIGQYLRELDGIADIISRLRNGHLTAALQTSDGDMVKIHLTSSPWVKYGLLMHYSLKHHACVAELRRQGIAEDDERVQPCTLPEAPELRR